MGRLVEAPVKIRVVEGPRIRTESIGEADMQAGTAATEEEKKKLEDAKKLKNEGDGYLQRVAKYVPAEVVGFFLFVNNILDQAVQSGVALGLKPGDVLMAKMPVMTIGWFVFVIAMVLTPLYVFMQRTPNSAWIVNAIVSAVAFPIWAYAMHAVVFGSNYDGNFASILLATFTVASGLIVPPAREVVVVKPGNGEEPPHANPEPQRNPAPEPIPAPEPHPEPDPAVPSTTESGAHGEPTPLNQPRQ